MKCSSPTCHREARIGKKKCQGCAEAAQRYYQSRKEELKAYSKRYKQVHPQRTNYHNRKDQLRKYGLSIDDYNSMAQAQGNKCAICREAERETSKNGLVLGLTVDHCHTTGKIRGLLCRRCNRGIGVFTDNIELLSRAIQYLTDSRSA